ncbi:MAG: LeuA family protein [Clostridium sp.]
MNNKTDKYWVTDFNFMEEIKGQCNYPERVEIHELSLREGDQTPGCVLTAEEKIELAKDYDDLGVDAIEMFAMVSGEEREALIELSKPGVLKHAKLASLARAVPKDVETAAKCGIKKICIEGPGNQWVAKTVGVKSEDQLIDSFKVAIKQAKESGIEEIAVGPWDIARGTSFDLIERFIKETVEAGATEICYADTYGFSMPWTVQYMIRKYREWAGKGVKISCHFHNDYGMATANTLAAVSAGCSNVQVAMNGLGERAGNTPLDEVALNLALNMGIKTDIKLEKIYPLSKKLETMSKTKLSDNKPIVGDRDFKMGSGLIVDMLYKLQTQNMDVAILPFSPSLIGRQPYEVVYGKGVGTNMVARLVAEMGFTASKQESNEISELIKKESILIKDLVPDYRVKEIVKKCLNK